MHGSKGGEGAEGTLGFVLNLLPGAEQLCADVSRILTAMMKKLKDWAFLLPCCLAPRLAGGRSHSPHRAPSCTLIGFIHK